VAKFGKGAVQSNPLTVLCFEELRVPKG
jgi:hypothetical protein